MSELIRPNRVETHEAGKLNDLQLDILTRTIQGRDVHSIASLLRRPTSAVHSELREIGRPFFNFNNEALSVQLTQAVKTHTRNGVLSPDIVSAQPIVFEESSNNTGEARVINCILEGIHSSKEIKKAIGIDPAQVDLIKKKLCRRYDVSTVLGIVMRDTLLKMEFEKNKSRS